MFKRLILLCFSVSLLCTTSAFARPERTLTQITAPAGIDIDVGALATRRVISEFDEKEIRWLALALYFEARNEPLNGLKAVTASLFNRTKLPGFFPTIEENVNGGFERGKYCDYSFRCLRRFRYETRTKTVWRTKFIYKKVRRKGKLISIRIPAGKVRAKVSQRVKVWYYQRLTQPYDHERFRILHGLAYQWYFEWKIGVFRDPTNGAHSYHVYKKSGEYPGWFKDLVPTVRIENHQFFRYKWGQERGSGYW